MILVLILLLVYTSLMIYISPPTVTIGDTAELTAAAATLGIAHSPGYPLFCNLYKIFTVIFPYGDFGYRTALGSITLFILTAMVVFLLFKKSTNFFVTLFGLTFLLSQKVLLQQSIIGEVFALHNFIFVIILFFMFNENLSYKTRMYIVAFLLGLSFGNQHITLFYLPGIFLYFLYLILKKKFVLKFTDIVLTTFFFILGMSIYLYIPVRSLREPLYDWEDPQTLDRFIYLFTRGRYGSFSLAQGGKISISLEQFYSSIKIFGYILGIKNIVLLVIAILLWIKQVDNIENFIRGLVLLIIIFFTGIFLISISGLKSITPNNVYIIERLITISVLSTVIFITFSLSNVFKNKTVLLFLLILNFASIVKNLIYANQRMDFFLYDYTINIFRNIPYGSILLSDRADETEFCIAYYQRLLGKRKDVYFIDCNASVTRSIYGEDYYKIWGKPRLEIRNKVESGIIKNSSTTVIYNTVLPEQTITKKYKFGLLHSSVYPQVVIPDEIFLLRNIPSQTMPRVFGLYITQLELLSKYYLDLTLNKDEFFDTAKNYFVKLFLETYNPQYLSYIAYYYFLKGNYSYAADVYNKILTYTVEPTTYVETLVNLGVVYERMNLFSKAEECYQQATKIKQNYKLAYYNLGSLYLKLGRKEEAINNFKKYLELSPEDEYIKKFLEQLIHKI